MSDITALAAAFIVVWLILGFYLVRLHRAQRDIDRRLSEMQRQPEPTAPAERGQEENGTEAAGGSGGAARDHEAAEPTDSGNATERSAPDQKGTERRAPDQKTPEVPERGGARGGAGREAPPDTKSQ